MNKDGSPVISAPSGSANALPLPITALGNISPSGEFQNPKDRYQRSICGGYIVLDERICFQFDRGSSTWYRVRAFSHLLGSLAGLPKIGVTLKDNSSTAHTIVDRQSGEFVSVSFPSSPTPDSPIHELEALFTVPERQVLEGDIKGCSHSLMFIDSEYHAHPRYQYLMGFYYAKVGELEKSIAHFNKAGQFGHPDALYCEHQVRLQLLRSFQDRYPETWLQIVRGDGLAALTVLRAAQEEFPLCAGTLLGECLAGTPYFEEGIEACYRALRSECRMSHTYTVLWSLLTDARRDSEAFEIAKLHLMYYPMNPNAYLDAHDSCLLLGDWKKARFYLHGFLSLASGTDVALEQVYRHYSECEEWSELCNYARFYSQSDDVVTERTETYLAKIALLEGKIEQCTTLLENSIRERPENGEGCLLYAHQLLYDGREDECLRFLLLLLKDESRRDAPRIVLQFVLLLSQLLRALGAENEIQELWDHYDDLLQEAIRDCGAEVLKERVRVCRENGDSQREFELRSLLRLLYPEESREQRKG